MLYNKKEMSALCEGRKGEMRSGIKRLCLLLLAAALLSGCAASRAEEEARLLCLNIGKADCMLLSYDGRYYLIDTGYAQTYAALETALVQWGVEKLDGVFLTHCHKDHDGGMEALAQSDIAVDAWYAAEIYYDQKPSKHPAYLAAAQRGMEVRWLRAGDTVSAGSGAEFTVLGPLSVNEENENNNSLVMRFSCPAGSILLAGDMKADEEGELLAAGALTPCDVLKAGHHGDSGATTLALLRAVRPQAALILTSGFEETDTPAPSTLSRLAAAGCAVYVSQQAQDALLVILRDGKVEIQDVAWTGVPARRQGLELRLDGDADTVTIRNGAAAAQTLTGCFLFSTKGEERLELPEITLAPGQEYVIGSRATAGACDLTWDKKRVWHAKKRDQAILYDAWGRPLAYADNGIPE